MEGSAGQQWLLPSSPCYAGLLSTCFPCQGGLRPKGTPVPLGPCCSHTCVTLQASSRCSGQRDNLETIWLLLSMGLTPRWLPTQDRHVKLASSDTMKRFLQW